MLLAEWKEEGFSAPTYSINKIGVRVKLMLIGSI